MDADRFRRAKRVIFSLHEISPEDWQDHINRVCLSDAQLREDIESLLAQDTGGFIKTRGLTPLLGRVLADTAGRISSSHPDRIGPYRILEVLGRGGMGVVYKAVQDVPIHREVALKLVRRSLLSKQSLARFETEQQVLAILEHPHIARVFEAGENDDGDPYFVMELVRGTAITDFCEGAELSLSSRLELMHLVCTAVHHAHQRGIIHRDLKPSNLLVSSVDGIPVPKIIDFGIAKGVESSIGPVTSMTLEGQVLGTLEYMSPEQARGSVTDTRTDIYALGVILFELLTGTLPHDIRGKPPPEVGRLITETPARRLREADSGRTWDPDLEVILAKSLATEPDQRYASAADFGGDLERHLHHRPVLARPLSTMYQIRKLIKRHRAPFALAATLLVSLVVFSITMSVLFTNQSRARDRAQLETEKTQEINAFLRNMFDSVSSAKEGWNVTVVEVLEKAAGDVEALRSRSEIYADICGIIGNAYLSLEQYKKSEEVFLKALAAMENDPGNPRMATLYTNMTEAIFYQGAILRSENFARKALERAVLDHGEMSEEAGRALNNLAMIAANLRKLEESEVLYRRALAVQEGLFGRINQTYVQTFNNLCHLLLAQGDFKEAERLFEESLALRLELWNEDHVWVAGTRRDLARAKVATGDYDSAEVLCRQALEVHLHADGLRNAANDLSVLAQVLRDTGRYEEALETQKRSLAAFRELYGAEHPAVARELCNLARTYQVRGEYARADSTYGAAIAMQERLFPPDNPDTGMMLIWHGLLHVETGQCNLAEPLLRRGLNIQETAFPGGHWQTTCARTALARCLWGMERTEEAREVLEPADLSLLWQSAADRGDAFRDVAFIAE